MILVFSNVRGMSNGPYLCRQSNQEFENLDELHLWLRATRFKQKEDFCTPPVSVDAAVLQHAQLSDACDGHLKIVLVKLRENGTSATAEKWIEE